MKSYASKEPRKLTFSQELEDYASFNKTHKEFLKDSKYAGCYYCCEIFPADTIEEWVRSYRRKNEALDCALCPNCGIDSVLPDSKVTLNADILKRMHKYWFEDGITYQFDKGEIVDIMDVDNLYDPKEFEEYKISELARLKELKRVRQLAKIT